MVIFLELRMSNSIIVSLELDVFYCLNFQTRNKQVLCLSPGHQPNPECQAHSLLPPPLQYSREALKHCNLPSQPTRHTAGPPPTLSKPILNSASSLPSDPYRLAQEAALKGRSRLYPVNQAPQMNLANFPNTSVAPITNLNRKSIEMQSTSLTNITHMDAGSSIDSDCSSMYNSSPAPSVRSYQRFQREPSNLTRFLGGTSEPVRMHRSVEVLPDSFEIMGLSEAGKKTALSKARTIERGGGLRECQFPPVHEAEESGTYSLPLEQSPGQDPAPTLPRRNANPISPAHRKQASQPTDQLTRQQSHPLRPTSSSGWLNNQSLEPPPLPRVISGGNYLTPDSSVSEKNANQEVKRIQLHKLAKQSYGFSISDDPVNLGVFVKNVDSGSVAERGDLKPLDKLIAVSC